jgi:RNA polymerase sigma-70 factor (ECF subfamily)
MLQYADTLTDEELVIRCKKDLLGNTRSYEILVHRHMNRVYSVVYRIVCHKEETEDITQEVFVKVYNNIKRFEQQASFSSWLYRIATNCALDRLDKVKRQQKNMLSSNTFKANKKEELDPLSSQPTKAAGPEENMLQRELRECISRVLRKLDRQQSSLLNNARF